MGDWFIKLVNIINRAAEVVLMNVLFLLCCIPVVTIGQAWSALYCAMRFRLRGDKWFDGFKEGLRTHFWRGVLVWTIGAFIVIYMGLQSYIFILEGIWPSLVVSALITVVAAVYLAPLGVLNAYLPSKFGKWMKNSAFIVRRAPHAALLAAVFMWLPFALALVRFDILWKFFVLFGAIYFALGVLLCTMLMRDALIDLHEQEEEA